MSNHTTWWNGWIWRYDLQLSSLISYIEKYKKSFQTFPDEKFSLIYCLCPKYNVKHFLCLMIFVVSEQGQRDVSLRQLL